MENKNKIITKIPYLEDQSFNNHKIAIKYPFISKAAQPY